jgi:ubiquinone/menaquinone biosynthesis C-methylase UbiE
MGKLAEYWHMLTGGRHTCPPWCCWTFDNPLRGLVQNPERILAPFVRSGETVADIGCGRGYFTIPLARMVGASGRVIAVDLQQKMLDGVRRRAEKAGLLSRIVLCRDTASTIDVVGKVDFVLAFWMVHEVDDVGQFFRQIVGILKPGGRCLVTEPKFHVTRQHFTEEAAAARREGLMYAGAPFVRFSRSILLTRP